MVQDPQAKKYFKKGMTLYDQGHYQSACVELQKAIDLGYEDVDAYLTLGAALYEQKKYNEAIAHYQKTIDKWPKSALAHYNCGLAFAAQGDYEQAIEHYEKAIPLDPAHMDSYLNLDNALSELGRYADAIAVCERAIKANADSVYSYHNFAYYLGVQGKFRAAREAWEEACRVYERTKDGESMNASFFRYYAAALQESLWDTKQSKQLLEAGLKIDPDHTGILLALVELHQGWRDELKNDAADNNEKPVVYADAKQYFLRAERILKERLKQGEDADTLGELGNLYLAMGDYDKAKEAMEAALKNPPESNELYVSLGVVCSRQKQFSQSARYFEQARQRDRDNLNTWSNLAEVYLKLDQRDLKQIEKAEAEFRKILRIAPDHIDSRIGLGETYTAMAEAGENDYFSEAIKQYNCAIGLAVKREGSKRLKQRELASVLYSLGYAQVKAYEASRPFGDENLLSEAKRNFDLSFRLDPEHFKAESAGEKLGRRLNTLSRHWLSEKAAPWLVLVPSLFVLVYAQVCFITPASPTKLTVMDYIALTFGSLVFIVVGLYLPAIQKLKGAGIELEKVAATQISTSSSLGISK